jgi:hypothetical protein
VILLHFIIYSEITVIAAFEPSLKKPPTVFSLPVFDNYPPPPLKVPGKVGCRGFITEITVIFFLYRC